MVKLVFPTAASRTRRSSSSGEEFLLKNALALAAIAVLRSLVPVCSVSTTTRVVSLSPLAAVSAPGPVVAAIE